MHSTPNETMVTRVSLNPPVVAKFIAVAIVPGPAKIGIASGETAILSAAFCCAGDFAFSLEFADGWYRQITYESQSKILRSRPSLTVHKE
jgi:hypothetical protein